MLKELIGTTSVLRFNLIYMLLFLHYYHNYKYKLMGCFYSLNRMLVYEFVDNGNLEQWLHGDVGPCSPLTWEIRMNIILGTAKG